MKMKVTTERFVREWTKFAPTRGVHYLAKKLKISPTSLKNRALYLARNGVDIPKALRLKRPWKKSKYLELFEAEAQHLDIVNATQKNEKPVYRLLAEIEELVLLQRKIDSLKASIKKML